MFKVDPMGRYSLNIRKFKDKILSYAINMILHAIYEPYFNKLEANYGFRPSYSPHSIFYNRGKNLALHIKGLPYFLQGDLSGIYPLVNPTILLLILRKKISDYKFLNLIHEQITCGIFYGLDRCPTIKYDLLGIPQDQILSPLLWNIYFHEFDLFVHTELFQFMRDEHPYIDYKKSLSQNNLCKFNSSRKIIFSGHGSSGQNNSTFICRATFPVRKHLKKLKNRRLLKHCKILKIAIFSSRGSFSKFQLYYKRYANKWILFTNASPDLVKKMKTLILYWLKQNLKLSPNYHRTYMADLRKSPAKFLGCTISTKNYTITKLFLPYRYVIKSYVLTMPLFYGFSIVSISYCDVITLRRNRSIRRNFTRTEMLDLVIPFSYNVAHGQFSQKRVQAWLHPKRIHDSSLQISQLIYNQKSKAQLSTVLKNRLENGDLPGNLVDNYAIHVGIDWDIVLFRLKYFGYIKRTKSTYKPQEKAAFSVLDGENIIYKYNSIIKGLYDYYQPILTTRSNLSSIGYYMKYSCIKTVSQKQQKSIHKLYTTYAGFSPFVYIYYKNGKQSSLALFDHKILTKKIDNTLLFKVGEGSIPLIQRVSSLMVYRLNSHRVATSEQMRSNFFFQRSFKEPISFDQSLST